MKEQLWSLKDGSNQKQMPAKPRNRCVFNSGVRFTGVWLFLFKLKYVIAVVLRCYSPGMSTSKQLHLFQNVTCTELA